MSLIKKTCFIELCVKVQLYISLRDNIFEAFLQKQIHSITGSTNILHNKSRWYNFSTRHSGETLYKKIRKKMKNTGILAALKILKVGVQI